MRIAIGLLLACVACSDDPAPITGMHATAAPTPSTWIAPVSVLFNCDAIGGTLPISYVWDFGDGMQASGDQPTHSYTTPKMYTATCTATDANGQTGSQAVDFTVLPPTP